MNGYPLIPENEYRGPESRPYSYQGKLVCYKGRSYRLGPEVKFVCRQRTVEEWVDLLRRQYAHGGYFAARKSYAEVLRYFEAQDRVSPNKLAAIRAEMNREHLPSSQETMLEILSQKQRTSFVETKTVRQLSLF